MSAVLESVQQEIFPNILTPTYIKKRLSLYIKFETTHQTCHRYYNVGNTNLAIQPATIRTRNALNEGVEHFRVELCASLDLLKKLAPEQAKKLEEMIQTLLEQIINLKAFFKGDVSRADVIENDWLEKIINPALQAYESWYKEHQKEIRERMFELAFPHQKLGSARPDQGDSKSSNDVPPPVMLSGNGKLASAAATAVASKAKGQDLPDADVEVPDAAPAPRAAPTSAAGFLNNMGH